MWTRFIHWQNKLTIDYFSKCYVPPICLHTHTHTSTNHIPFDFSASKNGNHSYGNHFLYIQNIFHIIHIKYVLFSSELKKINHERKKDGFRPTICWFMIRTDSLKCWFRPPNKKNIRFCIIFINFFHPNGYSREGWMQFYYGQLLYCHKSPMCTHIWIWNPIKTNWVHF